jgi:hypothetical protein
MVVWQSLMFYNFMNRINTRLPEYQVLNRCFACFVLLVLLGFGVPASAQVSGIVFRDFNANGVKDNTATFNEPFLPGVTVKAYDVSNAEVGSVISGVNGDYMFTGLTLPLRIEFSGLAVGDYSAPQGSGSNTSVQFVTAAATNVNFGVQYPDDYWDNTGQPIPQLVVPCYVNGAITNPTASNTGIVQFGNDQNGISGLTLNAVATVAEVGTVWGEAFQKNKNRYFFSAFLKRQAGLGPEGMGGVYMADINGSVYDLTGSFTLQGVIPSNSGTALNFGSVTRVTTPSTADNYLAVVSSGEPSRDLDAFAKVGTVGYGDIDIDEANQKLYMTNVFQNRIIVMDVSGSTGTLDGATPTALGALVSAYDVAALPGVPSCTNGNLRIWGLKIYKGRGYLGVVCDAMISQSQTDLSGYILSFDPANVGAGFTTEISLGMTYRNPTFWQNWHPWVNTWAQASSDADSYFYYQQPIISDIEFNENGDMTIAIADRWGNQLGPSNYKPVSGSTAFVTGIAFGDILQARKNNAGIWVMEGTAGVIPPNHTASDNLAMGYGNITGTPGEYFNDRSGDGSQEGAMGSLAKIMGTNVIVATNVDPYPVTDNTMVPYYDSGGTHWYNTTDGTWNQHARLYGQNYGVDFAKAIGLGDIEANLQPAPLEIGNRVWSDSDNDGIQDPNEGGIPDVTIQLYAADGTTLLATTMTDSNGNWYFNKTNVTDGNTALAGNQAGPQPKTTYIIRVGSADWISGAGAGDLTGFSLTSGTNEALGTQPDVRDNDAALVSTVPQIAYTTGAIGENNHTLDMGFRMLPPAEQCCTNEVYTNSGFETTASLDAKFPNSTLTAANNAVTVNSSNAGNFLGIDGWFVGVAQPTATPGYLINDATRASEGSQFWYLPKTLTNTNMDNSSCLQSNINLTSNTSCATYNMKAGRRYVAAADIAPFNIAVPAGGTGTVQPIFEVTASDFSNRRFTFFNAAGATIPAKTAVDWNNVSSSWERGWAVFVALPDDISINYSILESATAGILYDNTSLKELTISASGIGTVTCGLDNSTRVFTLNPVSNAGGIPDLKYTVTAPSGYTISPAMGTYGVNTTFTLAKTVGSALGTGDIILTIADEVNTECIIMETLTDPPCSDYGDLPAPYNTDGVGAPFHIITDGINLGSTIDKEGNGQPNSTATGDGPDEDGINIPTLNVGQTATITATATNTTGAPAYLTAFIDWNGDGTFTGPEEVPVPILVPNGTNGGTFNILVNVPVGAVLNTNLGARFRLSTESGLGPNGAATDGEIEDYLVQVVCSPPQLTTNNSTICAGYTLDLMPLWAGNIPAGAISFHAAQADANAGVNALVNTVVAPSGTTTYYIRSEIAPDCFTVVPVVVTVVPSPTLVVSALGTGCAGGSLDLYTVVTNTGGGTLTFHSTNADALAGTPTIGAIVSPASAANYYIRSSVTAGGVTCFTVKEVVVAIKPTVCGAVMIAGPN